MGYRAINFSAGPSTLPEEVLKKAAAEMLNYEGTGESVMEMSHRSAEFQKIIDDAEQNLRDLMNIPDDYYVLFLQGGGTLQFSMVPINLLTNSKKADYIITGNWAKKAYEEAQKFGDIRALASSADKNFSYIPKFKKEDIREDVDYVYVCYNNTIYGTHYNEVPDVGDHLLVADMSSCVLSEEIDVTKFGLIYAGAQKNVAPAGLVVAIIREDLLGNARDITPVMMNYKIQADADSLYNTPPCWTIYICKLVLEWIKNDIGGLEKMKERNEKKAAILYNFLDNSKLFKGTVVPFVIGDDELEKKFISEAEQNGFVNLKGHRTVGGMRASIYNAMPIEGVEKLVEFMAKFEEENK